MKCRVVCEALKSLVSADLCYKHHVVRSRERRCDIRNTIRTIIWSVIGPSQLPGASDWPSGCENLQYWSKSKDIVLKNDFGDSEVDRSRKTEVKVVVFEQS